MSVGTLLPGIILCAEKKTIDTSIIALADSLGCSYYIAGGFSSIYGAKKLMNQISEDITLLILSDYDKAGFEIQSTLHEHFNYPTAYRVLLEPGQVPANKVNQYFRINEDGSKDYELDVLNIHELQEVFLNALPGVLATEIIEAYEPAKKDEIMHIEIIEAISKNEEYAPLLKQLQELHNKLYQGYETRFIEKQPISFEQYSVSDIHYKNVTHTVKNWKA